MGPSSPLCRAMEAGMSSNDCLPWWRLAGRQMGGAIVGEGGRCQRARRLRRPPTCGSEHELELVRLVRSVTAAAASTMLHNGSGMTRSSRGSHGTRTSPPVSSTLSRLRLLCVHTRSNAATALSSVAMADAPTRYSMNCPVRLHCTLDRRACT
jgi:hypothetical protein